MSVPLLAAKLVELRQQYNFSQTEVADYLGMTREGYSHYERNSREPSLESLMRLSRLYKIDISELINEKTIPVPDRDRDMDSGLPKTAVSSANTITDNINHFLKIFTGKNSNLNLTDISKDDIAVLAQYKKLDKQCQREVQQFIKFKRYITKNRE
ncbi:MAG: helix-turn-helix transcriptional regulator [Ruminococcus sp.]|nr:helix-turn-helix transcriptional regulator [Ruminococcus sp.]